MKNKVYTAKNTAKGMLWNFFEKISIQLMSLILTIILARMLSPSDYGIIGMVSIFIIIAQTFIESGFSKALIQKQDRDESDYSTVLYFNIVISLIIYFIMFFLAGAIAKFYGVPKLVIYIRVLFISLIFGSLIVVQNAILMIQMNFKKIAIINFITVFLSGVIGIALAYFEFGIWALIAQIISRSFFSFILFWIFGKWYPKANFSLKSFKVLFNFGYKLLFSGLIASFLANINSLLIGKFYNAAKLGYYTRAEQFGILISGTISSVLQNATYPMLCSLQDNRKTMISVYVKLLKTTAMVVFPLMVGLASVAKPLIIVLLTEKWVESSIYLFWLSLSFLFTPISALNMNILNTIGRSDLFLKLDLIKIPFIVLTILITFPISLKAIAIGQFFLSFFSFFLNAYVSGKFFEYGPIKQILEFWKIIVSVIVMAFFIWSINFFNINVVLKLFLLIFLGAVVYIACLALLREEIFFYFINKIKNRVDNK